MAFKKGQKKPEGSGRVKGTPNRHSLRVVDDLEAAGINLAGEVVKILRKIEDPEKQLLYLFRLCRYVYPRVGEIDPRPPGSAEGDDTPRLPAAPSPIISSPQQVLQVLLSQAAKDDRG